MRVRVTNAWALLQGCAAALVIAAGAFAFQPYPYICYACDAGTAEWWMCLFCW